MKNRLLITTLLTTTMITRLVFASSGDCSGKKWNSQSWKWESLNNCEWSLDEESGALTITGSGDIQKTWPQNGTVKSINFQTQEDGTGITSIPAWSFNGQSQITGTLSIPNSVTSIGDGAFSNVRVTGELIIPNSVTSIGEQAFYGMSGITGSLVIPNGVTEIKSSAFSRMTGVTSISLPSNLTTIGNSAFNSMIGVTGSVVIPDSVTTIGNQAFQGMSGVTGLTLPANLTSIGYLAFMNMSSLSGELVIPDKVTTIGWGAFANIGISSLVIPDSVTSIGEKAFAKYDNTTSEWSADGVSLNQLTANAQNLQRYLEAGGAFNENANIICSSGECADVLKAWDEAKGTTYASNLKIKNPTREEVNADGSISIFEKGVFKGYKKKRIYTIDEANQVAGKKNTIKLRYK